MAEQVYREGIAADDSVVRARLAELPASRGRPDEAETVYWEGIVVGDFGCLTGLVDLLDTQRRQEAGTLRRFGLNADGSLAARP
jgi:hypothetical protein